ncbi:hypothetical protein BDW22DRAFT_1357042 [Trametopsis cervina]|nr:hypothetical protein BDW22DRAFT_1357042 [Trametopsis cervina]
MSNSPTVIREVTQGVWTFSRPFARFGLVPFGGRSTAIKLKSGDVWVLASTPLDEPTKTKLQEIGPVKYIVGGDALHYLFLSEFKKEYPEAKLFAPEGAVTTHAKKNPDLKFDGAWGKDAEDTKYGFEDDIQHCYFPGHQNKEVAFFHAESKTLVEADLLFNLPATEQYSKSSASASFPFLSSRMNPSSSLHKKMVWSLGTDKAAMKRSLNTVRGWDFDRIIPCHGDVIEKDGKSAFERVYQQYFE